MVRHLFTKKSLVQEQVETFFQGKSVYDVDYDWVTPTYYREFTVFRKLSCFFWPYLFHVLTDDSQSV